MNRALISRWAWVAALASAVSAFAAEPVRISTSNEARAGCAVPTPAQCQSATYLETVPCGLLQRQNQWTCSTLLKSAMEVRRAQGFVSLAVISKRLTPSGIDRVVTSPPEDTVNRYTPDLYSFQSQVAGRDLQVSNVIGVDKYALYEQSGARIDSCEEYVHEKYLEVTEFVRKVGSRRSDFRHTVNVALGPASEASSLGTRHLTSSALRGRDGRVFGSLYGGAVVPRNAFFDLNPNPSLPGQPPTPGAPNLQQSLFASSFSAKLLLGLVAANRQTVAQTWGWHADMNARLVFVAGQNTNTLAAAPTPDDPFALKAVLGTTGGAKPIRRRLDAELNELYDLQQKFRALQTRWARLNERYAGSGWTPSKLLPPGPAPIGGFAPTPSPSSGLGLAPAVPVAVVPTIAEPPETASRRAVLDELTQLLGQAQKEGCLEAGLTACDWSPKLLAMSVSNEFSGAQDAEFARCNAFVKGNFSAVKNVNRVLVEDPAYPQFRCAITTGSTITAQQFEAVQAKVEECRVKKVQLQAFKQLDDARNRVRANPELVDPATGNFRPPGKSQSRDEYMGNKYFGLGYSYEYGFLAVLKPEICKLQLEAGGGLTAYAKVFGTDRFLIDALARVDTESKELKLHVKVAGKNLFTPVNRSWTTQAPLEFNLVKTVGSGRKSVPFINAYIVIVVIPVKISAGIAGEVGLNLGLDVYARGFDNEQCPKATIGGLVEPFAQVDGFLEAGIDVVIAAIGIRGELNIITVSVPFRSGLGVEVLSATPEPSSFQLTVDTSLALRLSTLNGSLSVYGRLGWCPFCVSGSKELVGWSGPSWNTTFFNQQYKVNLADLAVALGGL